MRGRKGRFVKMTDRKIEILSPAGSYRAFTAAVNAGADAVYLGGTRFGARAFAENFTEEELIRAIREAHFYGRKVYLTVNTLMKNEEIETLGEYLAPYYECGLDAVIVQDMGAVEYIRQHFPGLDIHASTQMTVTDAEGAEFVELQGVTRVVPARELSLKEISRIRRQTSLEIECFVHGALCYCYSGQCLMSSMIGGRSGNRGQCAQPCRLPYQSDGETHYYLSPKDICTLDLIPDMVDAGIDSFKIEGRMKKPEYVAAVTSVYRKYTDLYLKNGRKGYRIIPEDREMLLDLYNRGGFSEGYYKQHNGRSMIALDRPNHSGVPAVKITGQKGREVRAQALTYLDAGDVLEITGRKDNYTLGKPVEKGSDLTFLVRKQTRLSRGTVLNRVRNESLIRRLDEEVVNRKLQRAAKGRLTLRTGSPAVLKLSAGGMECEVRTEEPVQKAETRPLDEARIRRQLEKTGNSDFYFETLDIDTEEGIFLPIQQLNLLRRTAFDKIREKITTKYERRLQPQTQPAKADVMAEKSADSRAWKPACSVSVHTEEQLETLEAFVSERGGFVQRVYIDSQMITGSIGNRRDRVSGILDHFTARGTEVILALPHTLRRAGRELEDKLITAAKSRDFSGVLIRNCGEYQLLKERGFDKKVILDHNLYVFNDFAKNFWRKNGVDEFTAPLELNRKELSQLGLHDCELAVYGYMPVMISAQCILKTTGRCRKTPGIHPLKDRYGNQYLVENCCDFCYNVIYSDRPVWLGKNSEEITELAPRYLRLQFTTEGREETETVLRLALDVFGTGKSTPVFLSPHTQGHFDRGVL